MLGTILGTVAGSRPYAFSVFPVVPTGRYLVSALVTLADRCVGTSRLVAIDTLDHAGGTLVTRSVRGSDRLVSRSCRGHGVSPVYGTQAAVSGVAVGLTGAQGRIKSLTALQVLGVCGGHGVSGSFALAMAVRAGLMVTVLSSSIAMSQIGQIAVPLLTILARGCVPVALHLGQVYVSGIWWVGVFIVSLLLWGYDVGT